MTTVTTVGDGTFSPSTVPGRASGIAVMVLGVGFLLALAGALIEHFRAQGGAGAAPEEHVLARPGARS